MKVSYEHGNGAEEYSYEWHLLQIYTWQKSPVIDSFVKASCDHWYVAEKYGYEYPFYYGNETPIACDCNSCEC